MANHNSPVNSFLTGNQLYKRASCTGRPKLFTTPADLLAAANEYFEWVENNPVIAQVFIDGKMLPLPKMRAMSLQGLSAYIGVCNLRYYKKLADFSQVMEFIYSVIYAHNIEGAAAGLLKTNIIARSFGL
jgi:hypothetical protein